jgi:hypothetical protein
MNSDNKVITYIHPVIMKIKNIKEFIAKNKNFTDNIRII